MKVECNPNHCTTIKVMGKSLIENELKIKKLEAEKKIFLRWFYVNSGMLEYYSMLNEDIKAIIENNNVSGC